MNVFIIEDEPLARTKLARMLVDNFDDVNVMGYAGSVTEAVEWLSFSGNKPDIVFMDVELSDGDCFEIFRQVKLDAGVIMTTAYENYAVKAFEVNSVDYILKPIELQSLKRAIERCRTRRSNLDVDMLLSGHSHRAEPRKRFIVKFNDSIVPVNVDEIAYFFSAEKNTWIVTSDNQHFALDQSLDIISEELDPKTFFRISRNCIVSVKAIAGITKQPGGRLCLSSRPKSSFEMTVSRSRVDDFLHWLEK